jgi:hypothetical protein
MTFERFMGMDIENYDYKLGEKYILNKELIQI